MGAEHAGVGLNAEIVEPVHNAVNEWLCDARLGCADERRTPALARVGVQRELADHQCLALDLQDGPVHLTLVVGEDPEVRELLGDIRGLPVVVVLVDREQDEQPSSDLGDEVAVDVDGRAGDPLDQRAHGLGWDGHMTIDSDRDLEGMRRAARVVAEALAIASAEARPGITTAMLDDVVASVFAEHGARSAPKLLYGFPGDACISINAEAVHGIPGRTPIRAGDLVTIDVTAELDGYIADAAVTLPMPKASGVKRRLAAAAADALGRALGVATAGATLRDLGRAVEAETRRHGFTVLREVGGHGVGRAIHEKPSIPNWDDPSARGVLHEGLVIAVEPIIAAGGRSLIEDRDGWTLRTSDGSPSAHAEHTIVVTNGEPIVLTAA